MNKGDAIAEVRKGLWGAVSTQEGPSEALQGVFPVHIYYGLPKGL